MWSSIDTTRLVGETSMEIAPQVVRSTSILAPDEPTQVTVCETSAATTLRRFAWSTSAISRTSERLVRRTSSIRGSLPPMSREGTTRNTLVADTTKPFTHLLSEVSIPVAPSSVAQSETWSSIGAIRRVTLASS